MAPGTPLPDRPPFTLRARILTPRAGGGTDYWPDGALVVDATGHLGAVMDWAEWFRTATAAMPDHDQTAILDAVIDLRPLVVLPGMVDLHVHLPQLPNAGVGAGLDLLAWLERYIFPLEREFDEPTAERVVPAALRAMAAAGTTTALMYGAVFEPSLDAAFRAAEAHGIRAIIGKVMMDRLTYDDRLPADRILEVSLRQSADLCARWHGRDDGRLQYAFTPRFAVSCTADMLRESATLAAPDRRVLADAPVGGRRRAARGGAAVPRCDRLRRRVRPGRRPRTADRARPRHPPVRARGRPDRRDGHRAWPTARPRTSSSPRGAMPLTRYLAAGIRVGLGSDVAAGPELVDLRQHARRGVHP